MRALTLADTAPPADPRELVARNEPDVVLTLGDLPSDAVEALAGTGVPCLGVHGNHDPPGQLALGGVEDLHLGRVEVGGLSFAGFEGCVRYGPGPHQMTQEEAAAAVALLPTADVLVCHCPPLGLNDEPDDPAHMGFDALRGWVEQHAPRHLLHGHTTPDPRTRRSRLGATRVTWVRGAAIVEL